MHKDLLVFNKIDVLQSSSVKSVTDDSVMVVTSQGEKKIIADIIMLAAGYHSQRIVNERTS